jgi:hypothetical protein
MISRFNGADTASPVTSGVEGVASAAIGESVLLIRGEYLQIPHLRLTREQVQRLWRLDARTCEKALEALVDAHFLEETSASGFVRTNSDSYVRSGGKGALLCS